MYLQYEIKKETTIYKILEISPVSLIQDLSCDKSNLSYSSLKKICNVSGNVNSVGNE